MNTPEPYYFARELAEMYQLSEGDIRAAMCCSVSSPFHLPNIALGTSKRPDVRRRGAILKPGKTA